MAAAFAAISNSNSVTKDIYSWGANSYGQLANGSIEDVGYPRAISSPLHGPKIVTGGGGHTLFVTENGQLYTCGWNNKGQLGLGKTGENETVPQQVEWFKKHVVRSVAGGWDHSLLCTDRGELYAWGSNGFGQLGNPQIRLYSSEPIRLDVGCPVIAVAAGLRHSVCITERGQVFAWGSGKKGQLGLCEDGKPYTTLSKPHGIHLPRGAARITQVVCGAYHTAALTESGEVYVWGDNKHGQMAAAAECKAVLTPKRVDSLPAPVLRIASGWTHLLAQMGTGEVMSWGRNNYGQLGRDSTNGPQVADHVPQPVNSLHNPTQLVCGSEHNMALAGDGSVLCWGWNEHGICGTGDEVDVHTPRRLVALQTMSVQLIGCGNGHSFAHGAAR